MPDLFGTDPVRLSCLRYVKALYEAATDEDPAPTGKRFYGIAFSTVQLGPLGPADAAKLSSIGIVSGPEEKADLFPLKQSRFEVIIEFRYTMNRGDMPPAEMAERVLGVVQQIMIDDRTLGIGDDALALSVDEVGNEVNLVTYSDRTVDGIVRFHVTYRHHAQNVYSTDPSE